MSLQETTKAIQTALEILPPVEELKRDERLKLLQVCEQLKAAIQTPFEATEKILFGPHQAAVVRIAIDVGLFNIFVAEGNVKFSSAELAEKTKIEEALLMRLIRMLSGMGLLEELPGGYKASSLGLAFASDSPYSHAAVFLGKIHEVLAKLPAYLKCTGYKNPEDAFDGPLQFVNGTKDHYFTWLESNAKEQKAFNYTMGIPRLSYGQEEWFDFFPVEDKLLAGNSKDSVVLVDVGGGRGHDLRAFHLKHPNLLGRLVLQDLPVVIDDIKDYPVAIELIKHDFFTAQPIRGARAYYLRTVIHDWPLKQAKKILEMIREAMGKDSLLLLYEMVIPDAGHSVWHAEMDLTLMASLASLERTREHWVELLDSAGFELKAVWEPKNKEPGSGSLLEAVPK